MNSIKFKRSKTGEKVVILKPSSFYKVKVGNECVLFTSDREEAVKKFREVE